MAVPAVAQAAAAPVDSGLFVIFEHSVPVAREVCSYRFMGDSLVVGAVTTRQLQDDQGQRHEFVKRSVVVVDAVDLGLMRYASDQSFQGHTLTRGILPGDTVMSYYHDFDGAGEGMRLVQPPGRLFVLDSQVFTLFDVLCRSLVGKDFATRRVQLLAMGRDSLFMPLATLTQGRPDTLKVGKARVPARHYTLDDGGTRFELWADARGRMLRLENAPSELAVERAPDVRPAPAPRRRPAVRR